MGFFLHGLLFTWEVHKPSAFGILGPVPGKNWSLKHKSRCVQEERCSVSGFCQEPKSFRGFSADKSAASSTRGWSLQLFRVSDMCNKGLFFFRCFLSLYFVLHTVWQWNLFLPLLIGFNFLFHKAIVVVHLCVRIAGCSCQGKPAKCWLCRCLWSCRSSSPVTCTTSKELCRKGCAGSGVA